MVVVAVPLIAAVVVTLAVFGLSLWSRVLVGLVNGLAAVTR